MANPDIACDNVGRIYLLVHNLRRIIQSGGRRNPFACHAGIRYAPTPFQAHSPKPSRVPPDKIGVEVQPKMSAPDATIEVGQTHQELNTNPSVLRMILIGPPGVGKGTQASLLEQRLGAIPLSSGNIFRAEIEAETDLGHLAQSYIKRGELVPSGVTIEMMRKRMGADNVRKHGFILDGFPRNVRQAEPLDEILDEMEIALATVVSLDVDDEVVVQRLAGRMGCT